MEIKKTVNGSQLELALSGRLDTTTAPELEKELQLNGITSLILDFKDLEYISSAGLRVVLQAQKTMNRQGAMALRNVGSDIMEIFNMTGFSGILKFE